MNIDPTDGGGQFVDRGGQYRSAIFSLDEERKRLAETSRERMAAAGRFTKPIVTEIVPATAFIRPKSIIRTAIRRIRYATGSAVMARAATNFSTGSGGRRGDRPSKSTNGW
jgi:hypothetical protein